MRCVAKTDGLLGKTSYVREGEEFETAKCPSWAVPVKKKTEGASASSGEEKDSK